jgi:Ca-activated chloride channel family protein
MIEQFLAPGRLWLLLAVAALAVAYVVLQRRRPAYAVRFTELDLLASVAPRSPGWRRHLPAGLLLLSLVALTVAFARPQAPVEVPSEQATIVLAIDTSLSMEATDVDPDRITAARVSASEFIDELPERFNVGLVSFSGQAAIVVPPTQDHASVTSAVQTLELGPSTAIGEAVFASLEAIRQVPAEGEDLPPARIVLLSDGTNTVGRELAAAAAAAVDADVPVSTIAYGTPDGVVEVQGQLIPVPVDAQALEEFAEQTGGSAFTAESGEELSEVYADIGSQVGTSTELREVTDRVTGVGLVLAAVAAVLSLLWTSRIP